MSLKLGSSSLNLMDLMGCIPVVFEEMVATISVLYFNNERL